jgi:hypothetical protein
MHHATAEFETERLRLHRFVADDADAALMHALVNDPD